MLTFLWIVAMFAIIGGIAGIVWKWGAWAKALTDYEERHRSWERKWKDGVEPQKPSRPKVAGVYITIVIVGALALIALSGATQVPATHVAVVENTWLGVFFDLGPGTHIFPFEPRLWPLVTNVTKYDLRRQIIEIGGNKPTVQETGVQADSNSPGRPVVYFWARGWAYPNRVKIIELHRRYGKGYLDDWVERVWVSSLKGIQGQHPYDYVGNFRVRMQDEVEQALQTQLVAEDEEPIVFVSQLAIVDFGYDSAIESYLDLVAQKEFERQQAEQQILINQQNQAATIIQATTTFSQTVIAADAEKEKRIREATGEADAKKLLAVAEAYTIKAKYQAEADGIKLVQEAVSQAPDYLTYQKQRVWGEGGADVPETLIIGLEGMVPFLDLLPSETSP